MFWCCCLGRLHRHQLHLFSYGVVALFLIISGVVITIFALVQKDSQIGKVWLSGPVLIVVGAVLCGKVMIDWGPAMEHSNSIESRMFDEFDKSYFFPSSVAVVDKGSTTSENAQFKIPLKNSQFPSFGAFAPISPNINMSSQCLSNLTWTDKNSFTPFDRINYDNVLETTLGKNQEKTDKTTQAIMSCEKCTLLWSILDRRKRKELSSEEVRIKRQPKVIGKFIFSELKAELAEHQHRKQLKEQKGTINETDNEMSTN